MNNYQLGIRAIHQKDIKTAIVEAKRGGFEVLEVHFSAPQFLVERFSVGDAKRINAFAKKQGVVLQTHGEIGQTLIAGDSIIRKAERQRLERMVKLSHALGARTLTLHPGSAPQYHNGSLVLRNENLYPKFYNALFEDNLKYIVSIAPKDLAICIENTDNFSSSFQKILSKYLKIGKLFLTWDIMKTYSYKPKTKLREDQWKFLQKHVNYVRNIHISGPAHAGINGYEKLYAPFFKLLQGRDVPMVIEMLELNDALEAKKMIRKLEY